MLLIRRRANHRIKCVDNHSGVSLIADGYQNVDLKNKPAKVGLSAARKYQKLTQPNNHGKIMTLALDPKRFYYEFYLQKAMSKRRRFVLKSQTEMGID